MSIFLFAMLVHIDEYFLTYHLISYIMSVVKLNIL